MSISVRSYKATCHSKSCINGVCTESTQCNVKLVNGKTVSGVPGTSGGGSVNDTPKPATDLPALEGTDTGTDTGDPIADFIAWIEELLARLFN